jgi:hypothetical protein
MRVVEWIAVALLAGTLLAIAADTGTDPAHEYAWGENVGWINFGHAQCDAAIDPANGEFSGHAWGENIGWLKFNGTSPDYGVRSMAFDTQAQGTPNWWLGAHGVTEGYDAGDGVPASDKYVMDTNTMARVFYRVKVTLTP